MTPDRQLAVAVVGAGAFGRNHARVYHELHKRGEPVELAAIVDADSARAQALAAQFGARAFRSVDEMLDTAQVDAASVAVPTIHHLEVAKILLESGVDVLIEKPLASSLDEADELIRAARNHQRIAQAGHLERFNPAVRATVPLVTQPMFFEVHRLSPFGPRALDVDVVLDLLVHDLDIALDLVGKPVTEIRAVGVPILSEKIDIASVRLSFEGGCVANLTASRVSQDKTRKFRFFQPDWYFSIDTQNRDVTAFRLDRLSGPPRIVPWPVTVEPADPLTAEDGAFLKACAERSEPEVTGEAGRAALKLALDILEEMRRGR